MLVGLLVVLWLCVSLHLTGGHPLVKNKGNFLLVACAMVLALDPESVGLHPKKVASTHRNRKRKYVNDIFNELGPYYVRRAYRMEPASFWKLCRLLRPFVVKVNKEKKWKNGAKNGLITTPTKISVALRYFAGGSPYDISLVHGIGYTDVFHCV